MIIACELTDAGVVAVGTAYTAFDGSRWHDLAPLQQLMSLGSDDPRGWIVAVLPPDTDEVDLELSGPAAITTARQGGIYVATWSGAEPFEPRRLTVYAGQTVYEKGDGPLTTRPR